METYIPISFLNDFTFCPRSIYFHRLYGNREQLSYQATPQISGRQAHKSIDAGTYSTRKTILQGIAVYSEQYRLHGKIDIFDETEGLLTERKKRINRVYDGYIFQLYGQYHGLREMGYRVHKLRLYSMDTNKSYPVPLPQDNQPMQKAFETLIAAINGYDLCAPFQADSKKCAGCIYAPACDAKAAAC